MSDLPPDRQALVEESARIEVMRAEMQIGKRNWDQGEFMRIRAKAAEAKKEAARRNWRPLFSYTNNLHRIRVLFFDTYSSFEQLGKIGNNALDSREFADAMVPPYPWYWSAGILIALLGISVWILTTRVKSLDRLK